MVDNEKRLKQLSIVYNRKSIFVERRLENDEWEALFEPHCWVLVEEFKQYVCYIDVAYGRIALFENDEFLSTGKFSATHDEVIALDKDYYGISHYIYTR